MTAISGVNHVTILMKNIHILIDDVGYKIWKHVKTYNLNNFETITSVY